MMEQELVDDGIAQMLRGLASSRETGAELMRPMALVLKRNTVRASRSNRSRVAVLPARCATRILMATMRDLTRAREDMKKAER